MDKNDQLKNAVEEIIGEKLDTFLILGLNEETGYMLNAGKGEAVATAVLVAEAYKKMSGIESMVEAAKELDEGKIPDELVKALLDALGGKNNG